MTVSREHIRQFLSMTAVGVIALAIGSLLKVEASPQTVVPSPSPLPTESYNPPTPVAIASPFKPASPRPIIRVSPSPAPKIVAISPRPVKKDMTWGITLHLLPFVNGSEAFIPEQFRLAKELGVDTVRIDFSLNNNAINKAAIAEAKKNDLRVIFIIPYGLADVFTDQHVTERTTSMVKRIVAEYKDEIDIWQLGNEVANTAIRQNANLHGIDRADYPEDRYVPIATWLKAAVKAVRETDPTAKTLVTDAYVHVGFFDRFFEEGGDFDILGWDWYSWISDDLNNIKLDGIAGSYRLISKLQTYKKPIWLTEVNRHYGSYGENLLDRQQEQADFIATIAQQAIDSSAISGFFVFSLVHDQVQPPEIQAFSIVNVDAEKQKITGVKAAFRKYQEIIQKNR